MREVPVGGDMGPECGWGERTQPLVDSGICRELGIAVPAMPRASPNEPTKAEWRAAVGVWSAETLAVS